jgi:hypothetical protein
MKKLIVMFIVLGCSGDQAEGQSLSGADGNGAFAGSAGSTLDGSFSIDGATGGNTHPPSGTDGGPKTMNGFGGAIADAAKTASGGTGGGGTTADAAKATEGGTGGTAISPDAGPAPDASAVGTDAKATVDAQGSKLTVTVQPGVNFTADVHKIAAALEKACEGQPDGRRCELGVEGLGFVYARCQHRICCPGCWDGSTCRLTITWQTRNSSVDDTACGYQGSVCVACVVPKTCKQTTVPGDVVVTGCQN